MPDSSLLGTTALPPVTPTQDEKTLALIVHIITLISSFIAPFVIYIIKKDESAFVSAHAKESLNFQLTVLIIFILLFISVIGILLLWILGIYVFVLVVVATIRASEGKIYKYPFSIKFFK